MNQIKTFKLLVVVLAIMNISLLAIMWVHRPPMGEGAGGSPRDRSRFLIHELHLNENQREQFDVLFESHQQKMEKIKMRGKELHDLIFDELAITNETNKSDSLINLIGENRKIGEKELFEHLSKVRALCNEKQKVKFDRIIKGAMGRMGERK
jgi:Spy/CpxP family protein refolding chaperone